MTSRGQANYLNDQSQQRKNDHQQVQHLRQIHLTSLPSPSGLGETWLKKVLLPQAAGLFHVQEEAVLRDGKA